MVRIIIYDLIHVIFYSLLRPHVALRVSQTSPGRDGIPGSRGHAGEKGEPGERGNDYIDLVKSNWKQCVWKRTDHKDSGLIQVLD